MQSSDSTAIGTFRRATVADAEGLATFAARTFKATFAHSAPAADMDAHLASAYGVEQQGRDLRDPGSVTMLVEHDGTLIAFAQVRRNPPPDVVPDRGAVELQRFYVDAPWHGHGIAQRLMAACRELACELGGSALWLSVWEHNARAIAFYTKAGYVDVGETAFLLGADRQADRVMMSPVGPGG